LGGKPAGSTLQRGNTTEEDQYTRSKELSDMTDVKEQRPR